MSHQSMTGIRDKINEDGDVIVYLVTESGVDGRGPISIVFASASKKERDVWHNKSKNKNWQSTTERVVNYAKEYKAALAKLDYLQKLILDVRPPVQPITRSNEVNKNYDY